MAKIPDTICVRKGEKARIFVHTICFGQNFFGPKQCKTRNTIKIGVSVEIAKNKNDTFFWKRVFFDMVEKVGFTDCVFEKLCFAENTFKIVFSGNTAFQKQKLYVEQKQKNYEK